MELPGEYTSALKLAKSYFQFWMNHEHMFWNFFIEKDVPLYVAANSLYPSFVKKGMIEIEKRTRQEQESIMADVLEKYGGNDAMKTKRLARLVAVIQYAAELK